MGDLAPPPTYQPYTPPDRLAPPSRQSGARTLTRLYDLGLSFDVQRAPGPPRTAGCLSCRASLLLRRRPSRQLAGGGVWRDRRWGYPALDLTVCRHTTLFARTTHFADPFFSNTCNTCSRPPPGTTTSLPNPPAPAYLPDFIGPSQLNLPTLEGMPHRRVGISYHPR